MTPGLYRFRSTDGTLLYIGASRDPLWRFRQHCWARGADIRAVASFEVEWFDSFDEARRAEVAAIKAESPLWNIAHKLEAAAASLGIEPSTLGERAGQGGRFYARLKEGKRVWPETAQKVRDKIAEMGGAA